MLLSRLTFGALLLCLAACADFRIQPLGSMVALQDQQIDVEAVGGRDGQIYTRSLRNHIPAVNGSAKYRLQSTLSVSSSSALTVRNATSNLKKMSMSANISLIEVDSGETLFSETITEGATLATVSSYYAQARSEKHGSERLAYLLADRVAARVNLFFLDQKKQ